MPRTSVKPLRPNPFVVYRDPVTGQWITIKQDKNQPYRSVNLSSAALVL
ncbi:MAG: hypothetical protein ACFE0I_18635 [Elainellaceae cyanobacterium]